MEPNYSVSIGAVVCIFNGLCKYGVLLPPKFSPAYFFKWYPVFYKMVPSFYKLVPSFSKMVPSFYKMVPCIF